MTFTSLFPTVVYTTNLNPSEQITSEMLSYFEDYILKNDPNNANLTGDVTGDFQIANQRQFSWLNRQVVKHCADYLSHFGVNTNLLTLYSSKSWPVVCHEDGGSVAKHNHPNSHLSVVFYLQSDINSGGELAVYANRTNPTLTIPMNCFIPMEFKNHGCHFFEPMTNQMIIFPSKLYHEVLEYTGKVKRYSVTYDIVLTGKKKHNMDYEEGLIHPDLWVNLYV